MKATHLYAALAMWAALGLTLNAGPLQDLPEEFSHQGTVLKKAGQHPFRAMGIFQIFEAALYTDFPAQRKEIPGNFPFALTLRYDRNFSAEQLINSGTRILSEQHPADEQIRFKSHLQLINKHYRDVAKGDAYTLAYIPDHGTTLMLNGEQLVTLPGENFARYYFSIWLGDHPKTRKLRDALHP